MRDSKTILATWKEYFKMNNATGAVEKTEKIEMLTIFLLILKNYTNVSSENKGEVPLSWCLQFFIRVSNSNYIRSRED